MTYKISQTLTDLFMNGLVDSALYSALMKPVIWQFANSVLGEPIVNKDLSVLIIN